MDMAAEGALQICPTHLGSCTVAPSFTAIVEGKEAKEVGSKYMLQRHKYIICLSLYQHCHILSFIFCALKIVPMYVCIYVSIYLCIFVSIYLCIYVSLYLSRSTITSSSHWCLSSSTRILRLFQLSPDIIG